MTRAAGMRFSVDAWDPGYGTSVDEDFAESTASLDTSVEVAAAGWRPIHASALAVAEAPESALFVDGVRRIDARAWIDSPLPDGTLGADASPALCASYAAGVLCCCDGPVAPAVVAGAASAGHHLARTPPTSSPPPAPSRCSRRRPIPGSRRCSCCRTRCSAGWVSWRRSSPFPPGAGLADHGLCADTDLLVVDGPLYQRTHLDRALGFIKSHRTRYLPPELHAVVSALAAGDRSPVFLIGTNWDRYTWYLRLPGQPGHPWAGIARVECSPSLSAAEAVRFANLSQAVLPRFASVEYKDSRAPQNLFPIAGLERDLRRRLGDTRVLYRALRAAAAF